MKRRRRPTYEPLTATARAIYRGAFGEALPRRWRVEWVAFMRGALGICYWGSRRILLSAGDFTPRRTRVPVDHEFTDGQGRHVTQFMGWAYALDQTKLPNDNDVLRTLLHEFIHVRFPRLRHGADFERLVDSAWRRLWAATEAP